MQRIRVRKIKVLKILNVQTQVQNHKGVQYEQIMKKMQISATDIHMYVDFCDNIIKPACLLIQCICHSRNHLTFKK